MQKLIVTIGLILPLSISLTAQKAKIVPGTVDRPNETFEKPKFIDEVKKVGTELVIPYKRYKLPNGLTILVHEDHSDPVVYVDVTYHVGSAREQQGRSGFAHFFEHMMFQGSKSVADEQHFKIITEAGGTLNGTTNTDRTNYFETVPSNQFEKMLWLEADRMGFLLDSVTQKKFEVQRATVKNERGQRYDNAPYGLVQEKIGEALFPKGHPYSWSTIGYLVDLDRVDVNDLKRFYMRWYGPNNAVLTVSGDVNTENVLKLAQKYFGSIPMGKDVKKQIVAPFQLSENRYISYEDNVKFPMLVMAYPTAKVNTKDDKAMDALTFILGSGQASPFYKAFIESKKAVAANIFQYSRELEGVAQVMIRANVGTKLADIETEVRNVLTAWEKKGPTDDDLAKFKSQYNTGLIDRLITVQGKGAAMASFYTLMNDANFIKKEMALVNSITKADIMRVYNTYIKGKNAVILSCVPKGKPELIAKADTWKMYERTVETESAEYKNLSYTEPKDIFDRSKMPIAGPAKMVPVPEFYKSQVSSIPLIGSFSNEVPKVNVQISFKAGHRYEPKEKSGVANLLGDMLAQSTLKTKAEDMETKLDKLGSNVSIFSGDDEINVYVDCKKENLTATLKLVEEYLFEPKFDAEEFEIEKKSALDQITSGLTNAGTMASNAFRKIAYGDNHIMSIPSIGTMESVNKLTINDVKDYYTSKIIKENASISVCGAATQLEVEKALGFVEKLKSGTKSVADQSPTPKFDKPTIYFVDKKNAAQSEIVFGYIAIPYDATGEYYKANIANFSVGGAFNSRINYNLREVKGWTYGSRAGFSGGNFAGPYTISGGFKANTTDSTLKEIVRLIKERNDGSITDEELSFTKNAMAQSDALKYESLQQKLNFIKRLLDYNLPGDYVAQQSKILNSITKEELNDLSKKYFDINKMAIIVVGDKASNFDKVKALGYEVIELDASNGGIMKKF